MLSAILPSDPHLGNPFSSGGFTAPWDCHDLFFDYLKPTDPKPVTSSSSGSGGPAQTHDKREPDPDDRKLRRMISNRESARRSRKRKQRHLENLRSQLNKCRIENRELNNRLQFILYHLNRVRTENEWLRSERTMLRQKISEYAQILVLQQLQPSFSTASWTCNSTVMTEL